MAVSYPVMFDNMYCGSMTNSEVNNILGVRKASVIPNLTYGVYDFPKDFVVNCYDNGLRLREVYKNEVESYRHKLRDYQTVGTAFLTLSNRSILGDDVGLGKTAQISALMNFLKKRNKMKRALVAVDNSADIQVALEIIRFTGLGVATLPSESAKLTKALGNVNWNNVDVIVIKHSCLRSDTFSTWLALNLREDGTSNIYDTFILDESSVIKNTNSKIYEYTKNICDIANRVHFLNATVFETNIMDIYNQVDMMNPELLPKKWRIQKDYCKFGRSSYWTKVDGKAQMKFRRDLVGYKNQERFKEALKLVYFGRSKKDVGIMINHEYEVYEVEPTVDQLLAIDAGHRYNEVLNCPSLIPERNIKMTVEDVPKLEKLVEIIGNEPTKRVMVYCFHTEAQRAIKEELEKIGRKPKILNGETKGVERWEIQNDFNHGECDVVITNIKRSLNLYGGDICIFYSVETVPAAVQQISGRIDRNVDNKTKKFILLLYKNTDEHKFFMNVVKQRAKDSRDLTIDTKGVIDYFIDTMEDEE